MSTRSPKLRGGMRFSSPALVGSWSSPRGAGCHPLSLFLLGQSQSRAVHKSFDEGGRRGTEHADAPGVGQEQQPRRMREDVRHQQSCLLVTGTERLGGIGDRMHGQFKARIEDFIAFPAETVRLHAAAKQIEAEI